MMRNSTGGSISPQKSFPHQQFTASLGISTGVVGHFDYAARAHLARDAIFGGDCTTILWTTGT